MLLRGSIFAFASQSAEHFLGIGAAGCKPHPIEPIPSPCPAASVLTATQGLSEQSLNLRQQRPARQNNPRPAQRPQKSIGHAHCLCPPLPTAQVPCIVSPSHRALHLGRGLCRPVIVQKCLASHCGIRHSRPSSFCLGFPFRHPRHSHSPAHHLYHLSTFLSPDPTTRRAHYCPRWDRLWYSTPPETLFTGDSIPK